MHMLLILLATVFLVEATPPVASPVYLSAREEWLDTVTHRLELARHLKLQRTQEPEHFRSDSSLARAMGIRSHSINTWVNRDAKFSLKDGLKAAAYLQVEAWWLLGYDILQRAYWSQVSETDHAPSKPTGFTHPRFGEILLSARHFDPRVCADHLETVKAIDAMARVGNMDVSELH